MSSIIVRPMFKRGLWGNVRLTLMHPVAFFRDFPRSDAPARAALVGALLLVMVGADVIIRSNAAAAPSPDAGLLDPALSGDFGSDPSFSGGGGVFVDPSFSGGGGVFVDPSQGGAVVDPTLTGDSGPAPQDPSELWSSVALRVGQVVLLWAGQAIFLAVLALFRGQAPNFRMNMAIAIYASVPLAFPLVLQWLYTHSGGTLGAAGLMGFAADLPNFNTWSPPMQSVALSFLSQVTLFSVWSFLLFWVGARQALRGNVLVSGLVTSLWLGLLVLVPVLLGAFQAPPEPLPELLVPEMPLADDLGITPLGDDLGMEGDAMLVPEGVGAPALPADSGRSG